MCTSNVVPVSRPAASLPVLLDEEYWSFQYHVFYNTNITSIVGWQILKLPVLCIYQRFWYSSIVNARYWYIQYCVYTILDFRYCEYTILDFRYCNITILVFLVVYRVTILVIPVFYQNLPVSGILVQILVNTSIPLSSRILQYLQY